MVNHNTVRVGWEDWYRGETETGTVEIDLKDFIDQNYTQLEIKHKKLREAEKRLKEQRERAAQQKSIDELLAKQIAHSEFMAKNWIKMNVGITKSYIKELDDEI